jgi:hypothetical protein
MGSSDPLPAGFEIRFGSLNFQATGNGYLMCITNRDELRARRPTGPDLVPVAPTAGALASAQVDAADPPAPRHRRRSGQRSWQARMECQRAARVASQRDATTGETATASTGEHSVSGPRFPLGLRGATTAYVASANTDATPRRARSSRHAPAVRNPSASTDDESSHGPASELPPTTSHGYAEWDFSGVPDTVMFRRLLDATNYWFGYSDNSSAGSYDPRRSASSCLPTTKRMPRTWQKSATERFPPSWELDRTRVQGQARLPPHRRGGGGRHQRATGSSA